MKKLLLILVLAVFSSPSVAAENADYQNEILLSCTGKKNIIHYDELNDIDAIIRVDRKNKLIVLITTVKIGNFENDSIIYRNEEIIETYKITNETDHFIFLKMAADTVKPSVYVRDKNGKLSKMHIPKDDFALGILGRMSGNLTIKTKYYDIIKFNKKKREGTSKNIKYGWFLNLKCSNAKKML